MRTFIALDLSDELKNELLRIQEGLKKIDADVKWVKTKNIHLTLKFLGNVEDDRISKIKKILDDISAKNKSFEISLFKLGAFPELNKPRVIWVGIDKGCSETERIAESIENDLEKIGFSREERPFSAHLTLGRVRSARNKAMLKDKILSIDIRPVLSLIDHITFFQSTLTPSGPIYTPLHVAGLKN